MPVLVLLQHESEFWGRTTYYDTFRERGAVIVVLETII